MSGCVEANGMCREPGPLAEAKHRQVEGMCLSAARRQKAVGR